MAVEDIQNYIAANQNRFPREVLIEQLRKNGYPEAEIQEALAKQDKLEGGVSPQGAGSKTGSWVLGFLAGVGILILFTALVPLGAMLGVAGAIFLFFWFRKRSPYFARGVLTALIMIGILIGVGIVVFILAFRSIF